MVKVEFYSLLRLLLKQERLNLPALKEETIRGLLPRLQQQISIPFVHKLVDEQGELIPGTIILVNRKNILHLDKLETPVHSGDVVAFFPPGAGG